VKHSKKIPCLPMTPSSNRFAMPLLAVVFALAVVLACARPANADDAFVCKEETQQKCDDENINLGLFIKGREAYVRGRETGDLSEARSIALELLSRKDAKHGKILMKYIYMQVGQGVHKDLVESYRWVSSDLAAETSYSRLDLERIRDRLIMKMTPEQLAEAKR
jgi:hypothetical protein